MNTHKPLLESHYVDALQRVGFSSDHIAEAQTTREVPLSYGNDLKLTYSRVNEMGGDLTFYIPGFTEGRVAKTPTALALAEVGEDGSPGLDVVYIDQQRKGIAPLSGEDAPIDPRSKFTGWMRNRFEMLRDKLTNSDRQKETPKSALRAQALGLLAVVEAEAQPDQRLNFVTHSMGSLVIQDAVRVAQEQDLPYFDDANIVLLTPAGLYERESLPRIAARLGKSLLLENFSRKEFEDPKMAMLKAGMKNLFANIRKSWAEARAAGSERLDIKALLSQGIGSLAVVSYGGDAAYSYRHHESITAAEDGRVAWLTPISTDLIKERRVKAEALMAGRNYTDVQREAFLNSYMKPKKKDVVRGATHNDEQFNPRRVGGAVKQYLASKKAA